MTTKQTRIALVTGAKARLGQSIARGLAQDGWDILVHYRTDATAANMCVAELQQMGVRSIALAADLADPGQAQELVARSAAALGPVSLLVNNASLFERDDWHSATAASAHAHYQVNVVAPLLLAQEMALALPADMPGCIINLVDQRVWKLTPAYTSYTLSKAALWTLTQTLAQALAPRVRVNAVGPGPTLANTSQSADMFAAEAAAVLLQSAVAPSAIADAVRYLAAAQHVTGQMIAVDSGQHLSWQTPDALLEVV